LPKTAPIGYHYRMLRAASLTLRYVFIAAYEIRQ